MSDQTHCYPKDSMVAEQFAADKILKHLDRIIEWQRIGLSRPIVWELDMTNICNNRCPWCFGFAKPDSTAFLSEDDARLILRELYAFGARAVTFTGGGEPLCNPATVKMIGEAHELGMDVALITNGLLLRPSIIKDLLSVLTWLRVSLDADNPALYQQMHGVSGKTFNVVMRNLKYVVEKKKQLQSKCTIGVGYLTCPESIQGMESCTRLCHDIGVDYIQFRPQLRWISEQKVDYCSDHLSSHFEACTRYQTPHFRVLCSKGKYERILTGQTQRTYKLCLGHHFAGVVAADKRVYLCCHYRGMEQFRLGDLTTHRLEEIWHSERRKQVYQSIVLDKCPPFCRCDGMNEILWLIERPSVHINFL